MIRILFLFPLALITFAQEKPLRHVTYQAMLVGNQLVPGFQNGYLFFLDTGSIRLYSPEGFPVLTTVLQIPNAINASAGGLAVDTDGSVAIAAAFHTSSGHSGGIAFYGRNGVSTGFIDTGRYMPSNICFGEHHSLWTFGWQRDTSNPERADNKDYMMVRRYSSDHKEQGKFLARSLFPKGLEPGLGSWQSLRIAVSNDRVGLLAWSGMNSSLNEWVELDLKGNLIRRTRLDMRQSETALAFTADGHLYRQIQRQPNLQVLVQATSEWKDIGPGQRAGFGVLMERRSFFPPMSG